MEQLKDKTFIITGAGGSVAGAVAEALAKAGARSLLVDRDAVRIQGLSSSVGSPMLEADVSTLEGAQASLEKTKEHWGKVDGLIHLVGDVLLGRVLDLDIQSYDDVFDTNMRSLFYMTRVILPELLERDEGFIAGIASQEAWGGGAAEASLFAAAKSAVASFLRSLEAELEDSSVGISIIYPMGPIDTASNRQKLARSDHLRFIKPETIAAALISAAQLSDGGRLVELPIYPPRRKQA